MLQKELYRQSGLANSPSPAMGRAHFVARFELSRLNASGRKLKRRSSRSKTTSSASCGPSSLRAAIPVRPRKSGAAPAASTPPRARGRRRKHGAPLDVPEQDEGGLARAASDQGCLLRILLPLSLCSTYNTKGTILLRSATPQSRTRLWRSLGP